MPQWFTLLSLPGAPLASLFRYIGGTACLSIAGSTGFAPVYSMTFDYGQRHRFELEAAQKVAEQFGAAEHRVIRIDLRQFGKSALTADPAFARSGRMNAM